MQINGIFKPEYVYQPRKLLKRIFQFHKPINSEFTDEILPWGMKIRVRPLEEHGKILATLGVIDLAVTETLWRLTQPGELTVDIGANIGYMTAVLATRVSATDGGAVWSFEAHPEIFAELKHNVGNWQQQFKNTQLNIKNVAISDAQGQVKLKIPPSFSSNRGLASVVNNDECLQGEKVDMTAQDITIASCKLDDIFSQETIGVLKIDVEGHELQVLKGAVNLLKAGKIRDCIFEVHLEYPTPVTNFFESMGYKVFRINRSFSSPILLEPNSHISRTSWQPTNFIATVNPERVMSIFETPGWEVLKIKT
jgi:FkbM family methyltransferase